MTAEELETAIAKDCRAVLFDFDGVLCHDRFYNLALGPEHDGLCDWIQENIFRNPEMKETVRKWMRGKVSYKDINQIIADRRGLDRAWLDLSLLESVRRMRLDEEMLAFAKKVRLGGRKIGIVTDNMDVFSLITIPEKKLNDVFDFVVNSSDHGCLKGDEGGRLFDIGLLELDVSAEQAVLLDDSPVSLDAFRKKGGKAIKIGYT